MLFGKEPNAEEFEQAALPHLNELYRTAVRLVGSRTEAEDLVQETYLQAWKCFHRFEQGTNCRAWLFRILINKVNHHRRRWFRVIRESEDVLDTIAYEPPIAEQLCDEDVLQALERIPEHYREAVLLADVQEFSYKEVAFILEVRVGTVMSRLSRGRKLLRAELAGVAASYGIRDVKKGSAG